MSAVRLVSWNIAKRKQPRKVLEQLDYDVALIQEFPFPKDSWERVLYDCDRGAKVLRLSDRVGFHELQNIPLGRKHGSGELTVSAPGIIAAAFITPKHIEPFIAVSLYARWETLHPRINKKWIYSDAMAHRAISDLSTFIGSKNPATHRIVVAGDFNLIHGATDDNPLALPARDRSVFSRLEALGLEFIGPQSPNGRPAIPQPPGLPEDTKNVPTYHTNQQKPETAANQLDYVFASRGLHKQVTAKALNEPEEWGPSDHCRIEIEIKIK